MTDLDRASSPQNLEELYHLATALRTAHHNYAFDMSFSLDMSHSPHNSWAQVVQCAEDTKKKIVDLNTGVVFDKNNAEIIRDYSLQKALDNYKALNIQVPKVFFCWLKKIISEAALCSHTLWGLVGERLKNVEVYVQITQNLSDTRRPSLMRPVKSLQPPLSSPEFPPPTASCKAFNMPCEL